MKRFFLGQSGDERSVHLKFFYHINDLVTNSFWWCGLIQTMLKIICIKFRLQKMFQHSFQEDRDSFLGRTEVLKVQCQDRIHNLSALQQWCAINLGGEYSHLGFEKLIIHYFPMPSLIRIEVSNIFNDKYLQIDLLLFNSNPLRHKYQNN